ncbi:MAG TPA: type III secretion protein [Spirochaetia bacterium]|nr:type III secretion protein [Spirochaetia bacterium]
MKKAVALHYMQDLPAPIVIAKGKGRLAERIREIAEAHQIEIVEDSDLADRLVTLDIGQLIPEDLYEIIAAILVFAVRLWS